MPKIVLKTAIAAAHENSDAACPSHGRLFSLFIRQVPDLTVSPSPFGCRDPTLLFVGPSCHYDGPS
jgi:hypothetical protein